MSLLNLNDLEPIVEQVGDWRSTATRVDVANQTVTDLVLSGDASRNGRRYREDALREAVGCYVGKPVFLDHASPSTRPYERSTRDLVGTICGARFVEGRIRGDIRVLETEAGRTFLALLESESPAIGMSHVILAERSPNGAIVEKIHDVVSVDAVVFPATTQGFREQFEAEDLSQQIELLQEALAKAETEGRTWETKCRAYERELSDRQQHAAIDALLVKAHLPVELVTEGFRRQLETAASDAERQQLIEERREVWQRLARQTPVSRSRQEQVPSGDAQFVQAIRGRLAAGRRT